MKKIYASLLALIIVLPLCACSAPTVDNKLTADDMAGVWNSTEADGLEILMAELVSGGDESIAEMLPYVERAPFNYVMKLTLNSDGRFFMTADEDTLRASCDAFAKRLETGMGGYLDAVIAESIEQSGYTEAQYREHLGVSEGDDLKTALGIDPSAVFAELGLNRLYERIENKTDITGRFDVKDDALIFITAEGQESCRIGDTENSFTITGEGGDGAPWAALCPMTFNREER